MATAILTSIHAQRENGDAPAVRRSPAVASSIPRTCEPAFHPQDASLYRPFTFALLRRYMRMSMQIGRLPQLLGREFFRSKVSAVKLHTFEDGVILVHDVERCIAQLDAVSQTLIARCVLQEYTHEDCARMMQCDERTIRRRLPEAVDALTEVFVERGLLNPY